MKRSGDGESLSALMEVYQFFWMIESHYQQRLSWEDAGEMRIARMRAEAAAAAQFAAMLDANPGGQLGHAQLNDPANLDRSGLL